MKPLKFPLVKKLEDQFYKTYDMSIWFPPVSPDDSKVGPEKNSFKIQWMFPQWDKKGKSGYLWPSLEVKEVEGKGKGLFAKTRILEGTIIPYVGKRLNQRQYQHLVHLSTLDQVYKEWLKYVMAERIGEVYIDGNPENDFYNLRITSLINEPEPGYRANCSARLIEGKKGMVVLVVDTIEPGEELTMYYGNQYDRDYLVGDEEIVKDYQPLDKVTLPEDEVDLWKFNYLLDF